jgi:hypothetical protein
VTLAKVYSAATVGLDGQLVEVEVDISGGLPSMTIVVSSVLHLESGELTLR